MSIAVMTRVWSESTQKGSALLLLLAIADFANEECVSWPSIATLARKSRLSERQCQNVVRQLWQSGELYLDQGDGRGHSNRYFVTIGLDKATIDKMVKSENFAPFDSEKGEIQRNQNKERVKSSAQKGEIAIAPDPSIEPSLNTDPSPSAQPANAVAGGPSLKVTEFWKDQTTGELKAQSAIALVQQPINAEPETEGNVKVTTSSKPVLENEPIRCGPPRPLLAASAPAGEWCACVGDNTNVHYLATGQANPACKQSPFVHPMVFREGTSIPFYMHYCPKCLKVLNKPPKKPAKPKAPRPRDPVFDTLATVYFRIQNLERLPQKTQRWIGVNASVVKACQPDTVTTDQLVADLKALPAWFKQHNPDLSLPQQGEKICGYLTDMRADKTPITPIGGHYAEVEVGPGMTRTMWVEQ